MFRWVAGFATLGVACIFIIAGSDRLFFRTVPLEQRLVAHNDNIRKKAQQELLGTSQETKKDLVVRLIPGLSHQDPFVRKWTAIGLALLGPASQDALPALLHGVSDPEKDVAQACRVALSEIGTPDPQLLPTLLDDLKNPHEAVRCEAAIGLAKLGPAARSALPYFVEEMKSGSPLADCYVSAAAGLLSASPEAVESVTILLKSQDPVVRRNASEVLAATAPFPNEAIRPFLTALADDEEGGIREVAAKALGLRYAPERGWFPSWTQALRRSKNPSVRLAALELLKGNEWTDDKKWNVAAGALKDRDPSVRLAAIQWLAEAVSLPIAVAPAVLDAVQDSDAQIRFTALGALRHSRLRTKNAYTVIAQAQKDSDPAVRCLAAEQLVEMGAPDRVAVARLSRDLKNVAADAVCAGEALAFAGRQNGDVVPVLIGLLQEPHPEVRRRALHVVMALGARAKDALPAVEQAQKDRIPGSDLAVRILRDSTPKTKTKPKTTARGKRRAL
jgi:HEAT repeat protein